jgi:hypothetical protein
MQALILAGDHAHIAGHAFEGVGGALKAEGIGVECTTGFADFHRGLAGKDLLVIHRDGIEFPRGRDAGSVPWMQPEQEEGIERFVLGGGALLALHNAAWGYPFRDGYRRTLRGYYIGHPPIAQFHVDVHDRRHPVTAGVQAYEIEDEQHWLHCDFDQVDVLLVSQGQDGRQSVSGWAHEYGEGRVVFLPHGHTLEVLRHPMCQKLLRNAARWLLRRDS